MLLHLINGYLGLKWFSTKEIIVKIKNRLSSHKYEISNKFIFSNFILLFSEFFLFIATFAIQAFKLVQYHEHN